MYQPLIIVVDDNCRMVLHPEEVMLLQWSNWRAICGWNRLTEDGIEEILAKVLSSCGEFTCSSMLVPEAATAYIGSMATSSSNHPPTSPLLLV